ncbi:hypothetical protein [Pseudoalteromonas prydzensis]|uniref:Uncharacterized protein n=1 Tax=Pseudoalteromonas prydzensis TaxID=182141 RepID=A0ABR9FP75_9GAMM|nr:hypothetical protein [Pseudoalteromonas prydzensis]MBE0458633.1 hypothetical protein [Pseudoalteromonas prydzensis]
MIFKSMLFIWFESLLSFKYRILVSSLVFSIIGGSVEYNIDSPRDGVLAFYYVNFIILVSCILFFSYVKQEFENYDYWCVLPISKTTKFLSFYMICLFLLLAFQGFAFASLVVKGLYTSEYVLMLLKVAILGSSLALIEFFIKGEHYFFKVLFLLIGFWLLS